LTKLTTFSGFLKYVIFLIIKIVVVLIALSPLLLLPVYFIGKMFLPLPSLGDLSRDPFAMVSITMNLTISLINTDLFRIAVFPGFTFALLYGSFFGLWERKFLAKMQMRVGPLYAGRFEGILQPIADVLKLLFKEIIVPSGVDRLFYWVAPILTVAISSAALAVIPVSE
jgi:NADH-quinone oxidoreductase subunit H